MSLPCSQNIEQKARSTDMPRQASSSKSETMSLGNTNSKGVPRLPLSARNPDSHLGRSKEMRSLLGLHMGSMSARGEAREARQGADALQGQASLTFREKEPVREAMQRSSLSARRPASQTITEADKDKILLKLLLRARAAKTLDKRPATSQ